MQETEFNSWVGKIPLKKGMATHTSILVWRILCTEERGRCPWGRKESDPTEQLEHTSVLDFLYFYFLIYYY